MSESIIEVTTSEATPADQKNETPSHPENAGSDPASQGAERRRRRRRRGGRGRRAGAGTHAEAAEGGQAVAETGGADEAEGLEEAAVAQDAGAKERGARADRGERGARRDRGERSARGERGEHDHADRGEPEAERERPTAASVRDDGAPADIAPDRLDVDGIKILNRLHRHGHQAYFVGGCVRDLLLDRTPKDYDICTSAHPGEVRSLFRNCRLIGRRFRLAHVFFRGGKLIEVSTFRANHVEGEAGEDPPEDLLITRDNVFGTAEEDSRRRDFTVNGLFYDIRLGRVIDYVDGLRDLDRRVIRTIGDPEIRLREDPVRILRAVRFAAKLGLDLHPATYAAMEGAVEDLPRCAAPRLLEEIFRLLRGGTSRQAFELLDGLGAMRVLLPPVGEHLRRGGQRARTDFFARLERLDEFVHQAPVDDSVIVAALLAPLAEALPAEGEQEISTAVDGLLEELVQTSRLPRRIADRARQLMWAQGVLLGQRRRRRSPASFKLHPIFPDALLLLELHLRATGGSLEILEAWKEGRSPFENAQPEPGAKRKRRRRRRSHGGHEADASAPAGGPPSDEA